MEALGPGRVRRHVLENSSDVGIGDPPADA
jgi:hypothetical protein